MEELVKELKLANDVTKTSVQNWLAYFDREEHLYLPDAIDEDTENDVTLVWFASSVTNSRHFFMNITKDCVYIRTIWRPVFSPTELRITGDLPFQLRTVNHFFRGFQISDGV